MKILNPLSPEALGVHFEFNKEGDAYVCINVKGEIMKRQIPNMLSWNEVQAFVDKTAPEMAKELYHRRAQRRKRVQNKRT